MKRPLVAAAAAVAALTLTSCGAVDSTNTAAQVGDREVTVDQLQSLMKALAGSGAGDPEDLATGTIAATTARQYLSVMVRGDVNETFLADHDEQITDADRAQAVARLTIPEGLPDEVTRRIEDNAAASVVRGRIKAPSADELERAYDARPSDLGVVCARQIVLRTEGEAQGVVDALEAGAAFEDQISKSIDPTAQDTGGSIQGESRAPCVAGYAQALDRAVVEALVDARSSELVGPVRTASGWAVLQQRPYGEVADALATLFAASAGDLLYFGYLLHADVVIDPRYGRWDSASASVVPLSGA